MIRPVTEANIAVSKYSVSPSVTSLQAANSPSDLSFEDRITISANAFRVESNVEDYLPQARDPKEKKFNNVKEYAEYLLMLIMKLRELKPEPGEIHVKMEDKARLEAALEDLTKVKLV